VETIPPINRLMLNPVQLTLTNSRAAKAAATGPINGAFVLVATLAVALGLGLLGCSKQSATDASKSLDQSFQQAAPETKQAIQAVVASLKSGDVLQAARTLAPVLDQGGLTAAQTQAVGGLLKQINDAIAANPKLETQELYTLRQKMFRAVDRGPRS
jgi:hypothetical protein